MMSCEEFEALGPDSGLYAALGAEAAEHLRHCSRCAALHQSWQELREGLRALAQETESAETPLRVEIALREAVRVQRTQQQRGRLILVSAWGLAAAAAVTVLVVWSSWRGVRRTDTASPAKPQISIQQTSVSPVKESQTAPNRLEARRGPRSGAQAPVRIRRANSLVAAQDAQGAANEFVALPYSTPLTGGDEAAVVRVRMQRASLGALGLPVNEERADEWVMVDLLVGWDGQPQAVRLSR